MKPLVIIGAGGHGRVVQDIALAIGRPVAGFLDDSHEGAVGGVPVLGRLDRLDDLIEDHGFVVAMGNQAARRRYSIRIRERGELVTLVHPMTWISPSAEIGAGVVVVGGVVVNANARIGDFCILNTGCSVDHDNLLADGVQVCPGARLAGNVRCGEDVFIGTGACIVPGVTIGAQARVGAGSVVLGDVPAGQTVVGLPARQKYPGAD